MIRRATWVAIIILLSLVGISLFLRDRQSKTAATATPTQGLSLLFGNIVGEPLLMRLEDADGAGTELSRNAEGIWVLLAPEGAEADQTAAQAAATQIGALRILSTVNLAPEVIGLEAPKYILTVRFEDGSTHNLRIGAVTPITDGYYAQLDGGPYQVVDKYGLDKLIELVDAPPFLVTPTPNVTASATPSATDPSATPTAIGAATTEKAESQLPAAGTATP